MFFCFVFQLYAFNNVAFSTLCRFWMHLFSPWRECFGSSFWFLLSIYEQLSCVTFFYRRESVFIVSYMHMSVCVCVCECANESVWFYLKVFFTSCGSWGSLTEEKNRCAIQLGKYVIYTTRLPFESSVTGHVKTQNLCDIKKQPDFLD